LALGRTAGRYVHFEPANDQAGTTEK
jgi:hypothetical protein